MARTKQFCRKIKGERGGQFSKPNGNNKKEVTQSKAHKRDNAIFSVANTFSTSPIGKVAQLIFHKNVHMVAFFSKKSKKVFKFMKIASRLVENDKTHTPEEVIESLIGLFTDLCLVPNLVGNLSKRKRASNRNIKVDPGYIQELYKEVLLLDLLPKFDPTSAASFIIKFIADSNGRKSMVQYFNGTRFQKVLMSVKDMVIDLGAECTLAEVIDALVVVGTKVPLLIQLNRRGTQVSSSSSTAYESVVVESKDDEDEEDEDEDDDDDDDDNEGENNNNNEDDKDSDYEDEPNKSEFRQFRSSMPMSTDADDEAAEDQLPSHLFPSFKRTRQYTSSHSSSSSQSGSSNNRSHSHVASAQTQDLSIEEAQTVVAVDDKDQSEELEIIDLVD